MKLDTLEQHWNALGNEDPLWAILSTPGKRGGAWDLEEFLATGQSEINDLLSDLRASRIEIGHGRALDFGCGIGRLTQALADHFEQCDGVDLARSMIDQAVALNQRLERCQFHHNPAPHLRLVPDRTYDFVLSLLVLQHMEPTLMKGYVREFIRVLRPEGIAYFNVPDTFLLGDELPPMAARASIKCRVSPPILAPRETLTLILIVQNQSELPWPASARLRVGNHWLARDGRTVVNDDGRTAIETAVPVGDKLEVKLDVVAPDAPGAYELEVDLLQEHRSWFADLGSAPLRLPAIVSAVNATSESHASRPPASRTDAVLAPQIEMHVMSRQETVALIEQAGGVVLDVTLKDRCGASALSFDYVVGRSSDPASRRRLPKRSRVADRPLPPPAPPLPPEDLWAARAGIDDRAELLSFRLSSRRRLLGPPSVLLRTLLRRVLLEVLERQTEFNRASTVLVHELERQIEQLRTRIEAQEDLLAAAVERIEYLEDRQRKQQPGEDHGP